MLVLLALFKFGYMLFEYKYIEVFFKQAVVSLMQGDTVVPDMGSHIYLLMQFTVPL